MLRFYKPYSAGVRHRVVMHFRNSYLGKIKVNRSKQAFHRHFGRNQRGVKTCRGRSQGHKRLYRALNPSNAGFNFLDKPGTVVAFHYDPYRNARLACVLYDSGEQRFMLAPNGLNLGQAVLTCVKANIATGNRLPLHVIPLGTAIHDVEHHPGCGGVFARAAGAYAVLIAKEASYACLRLPSGEVRFLLKACWATIGVVGNMAVFNTCRGKAGLTRHLGFRPKVRGSAMNPCDHPHGGGEGKTPIGRPSPVSLWGKKTLGVRTRNLKKPSQKLILQRRKSKR